VRINTNINALVSWRNLTLTNKLMNKSLERLSSGLRINRAADDAAGLAISQKMRTQINGLRVAQRNAQDAISLVNTAEGALQETQSILQRMHDLALQAANDTLTTEDRLKIQDEIDALIAEIDRIAQNTEFNTKKLLNGNVSGSSAIASYSNDTTSSAGISGVEVYGTVAQGTYNIIVESGPAGAATATVSKSTVLYADSGMTTPATGSENLTALYASSGTSLGLEVGDEITIVAQVGGEWKHATLKVETGTTLDDLAMAIKTAFGASDVSITAGEVQITGQAGADNAITNISITAVDSDGNARSTFNAAFQQNQTQVAADAGDYVVYYDADNDSTRDGNESAVAVKPNSTVKDLIDGLAISFDNSITAGGTATIDVSRVDNSMTIQIGASQGQNIAIGISDMGAGALGLVSKGLNIDVTTQYSADKATTVIAAAIETVSMERAKLGSFQNRLEHTINNLAVASENLTAAESRIKDIDMALEMMNFTRNQIMLQAGTAMLAQANVVPQTVLQLLG